MKDIPQIIEDLKKLVEGKPWGLLDRVRAYILVLESLKGQPKQRTLTQNSALHKFCDLLSTALNDAGLPLQTVLKVNVDWNPQSVKDYIFRPVMKAKFGYKSTTELKKVGEIDLIHEIIMRELGEKWHIEYIPFPSQLDMETWESEARKLQVNYPTK